MAYKVSNVKRVFIIQKKDKSDNITLPDPNPKMEPGDVQKFFASEYPELTTSNVKGPKMREGVAEYHFETIIGSKG